MIGDPIELKYNLWSMFALGVAQTAKDHLFLQ